MSENQSIFQSRITRYGEDSPENLLANPFNFRRHPKDQQDALKGVLRSVGWVQNVIVNENTGHMIDGHLRVELAMRENVPMVPVTYVHLTEQEERVILATLDPIAGLAATDDELLQDLLQDMHTGDELLDEFLASMRNESDPGPETGNTDEDNVPAEPKVAVTKPGDVWILGDHRLMCGDSTKVEDLRRLMDGHAADMVWTDPTYNVDYEGGSGAKTKIENDHMEDAAFRHFLLKAFTALESVTKPGGCAYIAHADSEGRNFRAAFEDSGWLPKQCLIWVKDAATLSRQDYNWQHEPILFGWKPGAAHYFAGDFTLTTVIDDQKDPDEMSKEELLEAVYQMRAEYPSTVIRADKPARSELHPTMKPVAVVRRCINASSRHGERIVDAFGGSGTTLIACQTIGRIAYLMEFDPIFADVIVERWQEFTGGQAVREGDEAMFDDVKEQQAA